MDSNTYTVVLVTLNADGEDPVYLTDAGDDVEALSHIFKASPGMAFEMAKQTVSMDSDEGWIRNIPVAGDEVRGRLYGAYPYTRVSYEIQDAVLNDDRVLISSQTIGSGLVYQSSIGAADGLLDLSLRGYKYYASLMAGIPCTEYCFVKHFGDALCQAAVPEYTVTVVSVSGYDAVVSGMPSVADYLFNKGYIEYKGTAIKIKFWQSGNTLQTSKPVPSEWVGKEVSLKAGCDKRLETCRTIHNNEEHFSGWGFSMVDYNPQTENYVA